MHNVEVKNASDEKQIKAATERQQSKRDHELNDLRAVLNLREGRRFIWRLLGHCRINGSIWSQSSQIHYNAGMQDVGHYLVAEITEADQNLFLEMMKENQKGGLNV